MYEQFRIELQAELGFLPASLLEKTLAVVDKLSESYEITEKETHLATCLTELPKEVKAFLIAKKVEGCSPATIETYFFVLGNFFGCVQKFPKEITAVDLRVWLYQYQEERGVESSTVEYYRGIINNFFVWAQREGCLASNPVATVRPIRCEKKQRSALTRVELEYLRSACKSDRELAIIETFYSTGCRVSELINVKKSDVDWNRKTVHVLGKGDKHRTCYINARCEVALKRYLASRPDNGDYLFVSLRAPYAKLSKSGMEKAVDHIYKRVSDKISKKVTPHILRHTTATLALQEGMKITNISALLGHSKIDTTMVYAETDPQDVYHDHVRCVV